MSYETRAEQLETVTYPKFDHGEDLDTIVWQNEEMVGFFGGNTDRQLVIGSEHFVTDVTDIR